MTDILIIGGGPAGLTAAIYAARAGRTVTVCERESMGGQITHAHKVSNYPGLNEISGVELGDKLCGHAMDLGAEIQFTAVTSLTKDENGIYDVDDSVVGIVRTEGPVVSFNGAWAQNIGEREMFIDFMGDKAGIRLQYCSDFQLWSVKNGMLTETKVSTKQTDMYENEINDFIRCIKTGDKNQQYIDYAVETSKILQAIYDSSDSHSEIKIN